jgi:RND family efflux transporter MFP subunit
MLLLAVACGGGEVEEARPPRPVRQHVVGYAAGGAVRTFSGTAQAGRIVNLSFRSSGVITKFDLRLGQRVGARRLLARLDNVSARLAYEQALSALNSAASQMNTAKLALDRTRALYEVGTASLGDLESAKNSFRTAEASHESSRRSVEIQQEQLKYGVIYAPEAGTIAAVSAEINENVSAGQTVAVLNAGSEMKIALGLPESVINQVSVPMQVSVSFSALPDRSFSGRVTEVSPSVDASTATYPVRIIIDDASEDIRTGMAADVAFGLGGRSATSGALVIPSSSVGEDSAGRFVFLILPEGGDREGAGKTASVHKQHITIGDLTAEGFVVREGLEAGQAIATAGLQTLLDGQRVRIQ